MHTHTNISSVPAPAIEWVFTNWPSMGLIVAIFWIGWKYFTWLDKRFEDTRNISMKLVSDERAATLQLFTLERAVILQLVNERFDNFEKVMDLRFTVIDQRFAAIDQRFIAIEQRFTTIEKRLDKIDDKLEIQNQINTKLFTLLDANQKAIVLNR